MPEPRARLHVCTTCTADEPPEPNRPALGQKLLDALLAATDGTVMVRPVTCLASCDQGCTAAISQMGKWSYLLGHLSPGMAQDILTYAAAYAQSKTGTVLPSRRPTSLQHVILGRFPAQDNP